MVEIKLHRNIIPSSHADSGVKLTKMFKIHLTIAQNYNPSTREMLTHWPMLFECWPSVFDAGPAFKQHWLSVSYFLGCISRFNEVSIVRPVLSVPPPAGTHKHAHRGAAGTPCHIPLLLESRVPHNFPGRIPKSWFIDGPTPPTLTQH